MKQGKVQIKRKLNTVISFLFNPKLLLCFGVGWIITNGWSYVLLGCGIVFEISWMVDIAIAYITFLWFPFTPEKLITVTIAIFLMKKFFPNDDKTLGVLKKIHAAILTKKKECKENKNSHTLE